ncbi:Rho GTPase-activating protein 19 [Neisseria meningitidis]|uniref:Rho GTPase-activating protein 19 n=1 Tax=Neisseria meningitidis TaxID=487 RepID=A0A425B3V4_NEIME|nr:Rho GTPase-activating protein 19 [Neisseria meningitidis]MBG8626724.1 Rho GTPase-activating protein 19 [Neisseria meningitidis]MBG8633346.1 Rho GTPase-activating protein 19 [Neisseria meningitidis]MBG8659885.1 Rho GTPase-activating protein 19 [Neisseria meningitidis]MBG8721954.1 Rho GTPase-activating protein 19 [Neisseria meningitidis]
MDASDRAIAFHLPISEIRKSTDRLKQSSVPDRFTQSKPLPYPHLRLPPPQSNIAILRLHLFVLSLLLFFRL